MKEKGFTLIELLAVIVILAIIALIATPMILGVIDTAKKGSFENSVNGVIKSAETDLAQKQLGGTNISYPYYYYLNENELTYKGKKLQSGIVMVEKDNITVIDASDGTYCANGTTGSLAVEKKDCESELPLVFYEELTFDNNTWNNEFFKKQDSFLFSDGAELHFPYFEVKNGGFTTIAPATVEEVDKNIPMALIEFTTPSVDQTYSFSFDYQISGSASSWDKNYFVMIITDNLEDMSTPSYEYFDEVLSDSVKHVEESISFAANKKYYIAIEGVVQLDNMILSGIKLKEQPAITIKDSTYYDTYVDAGVEAFDQKGQTLASPTRGIKGTLNGSTFAYLHLFQTKKGIRTLTRNLSLENNYSTIFDFWVPCRKPYSNGYITLLQEIPSYTIEIFETSSCVGDNSWHVMEKGKDYDFLFPEGNQLSRSCSNIYTEIRILKDGNVIDQLSIADLFLNHENQWWQCIEK